MQPARRAQARKAGTHLAPRGPARSLVSLEFSRRQNRGSPRGQRRGLQRTGDKWVTGTHFRCSSPTLTADRVDCGGARWGRRGSGAVA